MDITGKRIQLDILSEVKEAKFNTIITDEVRNIWNNKQLSLCLRYVNVYNVKEVFHDFIRRRESSRQYSSLPDSLGSTTVNNMWSVL